VTGLQGGDRGQTEVLGALLVAALVVGLVALVGTTVVLPLVSADAGVVVEMRASVTTDQATVYHDGGETVRTSSLVVIVSGPDGETRVPAENVHTDGRFRAGEQLTVGGLSLDSGDRVQVRIVHERSNRLLYDGRKVARLPSGPGSRRLVWATESDWDAGSGNQVVHDEVGDRRGNRLQLGYEVGADAPGLVGYYTFAGESGVDVRDATGTNDGTFKDSSQIDHEAYDRAVSGIFGGSGVRFTPQKSGITYEKGAYVDLGSDTASAIAGGSFTWSAWVRTDREGGGKEAVISANNDDRTNNILWFLCKPSGGDCPAADDDEEPAYLSLYIGDEGDFHPDDSGVQREVNDGDWHHIAVSLEDDTGRVTYYVDGVAVHSYTTGARVEADDIMSIGQDSDDADYGFGVSTSDFLEGDLDEVRIYDRALDPDAIDRLSETTGTHVTTPKQFTAPVDGDAVTLSGVNADPGGGTITVYVEADTDGDGTFEQTSAPVSLSASQEEYDVSFGAGFDAETYRVRVEMKAPSGGEGPVLDRIDLDP